MVQGHLSLVHDLKKNTQRKEGKKGSMEGSYFLFKKNKIKPRIK